VALSLRHTKQIGGNSFFEELSLRHTNFLVIFFEELSLRHTKQIGGNYFFEGLSLRHTKQIGGNFF
jgi:hypothetical protein